MEQLLVGSESAPKGMLRVNASPGFGRSYIAPLISRFMLKHPDMQVQLQLSVDPPAYSSDAFDVCIRFGEPPDERIIARRLASNRRMLYAAPAYLARHGPPAAPKQRDRNHRTSITTGKRKRAENGKG